jgi:anti-anti-sigma factor
MSGIGTESMTGPDYLALPEPFGLQITRRRENETLTIELAGELDIATCPRLRRELRKAEADGAGALIVDLSRLSFIDANGLRLLLDTNLRSSDEGGRGLVLLRAPGHIQQVFEIAGVHDRFLFLD